MTFVNDPPFALGQTLGVSSTDDGGGWVGTVKQFPDVDPTTGQVRSNRVKTCIAVRNTSGGALLPKRAVVFAAGSFEAVDAYTTATDEIAAGVVDEHLASAGVAANDVFWVTVGGPTEITSGAAIPVDSTVSSLNAGAGKATTAAAGALQKGYIGRAISAAAGADEDILAIVNLVRS